MKSWRVTTQGGMAFTVNDQPSITHALTVAIGFLTSRGTAPDTISAIVEVVEADGSGNDAAGTEGTPVVKDGRTLLVLRGGRG